MDAAQHLEPCVSDVLTWAEICERYPHQHVVLTEIERPDMYSPDIRTARVIAHGHDENELFDLMDTLGPRHRPIALWSTDDVTYMFSPRIVVDDED